MCTRTCTRKYTHCLQLKAVPPNTCKRGVVASGYSPCPRNTTQARYETSAPYLKMNLIYLRACTCVCKYARTMRQGSTPYAYCDRLSEPKERIGLIVWIRGIDADPLMRLLFRICKEAQNQHSIMATTTIHSKSSSEHM